MEGSEVAAGRREDGYRRLEERLNEAFKRARTEIAEKKAAAELRRKAAVAEKVGSSSLSS